MRRKSREDNDGGITKKKKAFEKSHMEIYYSRNCINEHKFIEQEFKLDYPVT